MNLFIINKSVSEIVLGADFQKKIHKQGFKTLNWNLKHKQQIPKIILVTKGRLLFEDATQDKARYTWEATS